MNGWKYMVRLYRPLTEILNGTRKFPEAQPVNCVRPAFGMVSFWQEAPS
jgi:hypothetical protein